MAASNPQNEIKLMILYMLSKVSFSLNHESLSNFFLDKYSSYIVFQQILGELIETKLVEEYKTKTSVFYTATNDGIEAIEVFSKDISENHKKELDEYIEVNKYKLKEESIVSANYSDGGHDNFRVTLEINENKDEVFRIEIDVPTADAAITLCESWKEKAKNIYTYIIKQLL